MAEKWPENLPYADTSWSVERQDNVLRFTPERGQAKVRRLVSKAVDHLTVTLTLTPAQYRTFRYWWKIDLNDGLRTFEYPDYLDDGTGFEARFLAPPQTQRNGENITVTLKMELL